MRKECLLIGSNTYSSWREASNPFSSTRLYSHRHLEQSTTDSGTNKSDNDGVPVSYFPANTFALFAFAFSSSFYSFLVPENSSFYIMSSFSFIFYCCELLFGHLWLNSEDRKRMKVAIWLVLLSLNCLQWRPLSQAQSECCPSIYRIWKAWRQTSAQREAQRSGHNRSSEAICHAFT